MTLVLRHQTTGREFAIDLGADEDLRLWLPEPGKTDTLEITVNLPRKLPIGRYELFLNLPDPARRLRERPEYSVRLANQGVWEAKTGYNRLDASLEVTR